MLVRCHGSHAAPHSTTRRSSLRIAAIMRTAERRRFSRGVPSGKGCCLHGQKTSGQSASAKFSMLDSAKAAAALARSLRCVGRPFGGRPSSESACRSAAISSRRVCICDPPGFAMSSTIRHYNNSVCFATSAIIDFSRLWRWSHWRPLGGGSDWTRRSWRMVLKEDLSTDRLRSRVDVLSQSGCIDRAGNVIAVRDRSLIAKIQVDLSRQRPATSEFDERLNTAVDIAPNDAFDIGGLIAGSKDTRQFVQDRPRRYGKMVGRRKRIGVVPPDVSRIAGYSIFLERLRERQLLDQVAACYVD